MAFHPYDLILPKLGLQPGLLSEQTAVITGAGQGIGKEAALAFAWLGANVVIAELAETGQAVAAQIQADGGRAVFIRTDVSDPDSVAQLLQHVEQRLGVAAILVNNAILCPVASVLEMDLAVWDRVMAVNLRGAFLTCKAFLPGMLARRRGTIVNMISTDAMAFLSAYMASKQGLAAFSKSLASEVGESGIHVVAFGPGMVATPGLASAAEGLAPHFGLTKEEFLNLPLHPAYPGAMPVEDAGAATAYLVAKLAADYHGEITTGYDVLEKAGYLSSAGASEASTLPEEPLAAPNSQADNKVGELLKLVSQLQAIIASTDEEFNKLPVFVRPMARGGFKSKSGQSLPDWKQGLSALCGQVEAARTDPQAASALHSTAQRWQEQLARLAEYYRGVPAETARFTKDKDFLQEVAHISAERVAVITALSSQLAGIE